MSPIWAGGHASKILDSTDDYVFFLSKDEVPFGCFSNAYREKGEGHVGLKESTGESDYTTFAPKFWCVNQELHYRKAIVFGDDETAALILGEKEDAGKIKQYGRMVKGYDDSKWTGLRYDAARDAVHAKFACDDELKKILLDTGDKIIIEAATDKAWGAGVVEFTTGDKKGAKNKETGAWDIPPGEWEGQNLLGRCLMDVRRKLREN
ncbi:hypothetical protein ACHAXS_002910 [Conticribra weissflogii]